MERDNEKTADELAKIIQLTPELAEVDLSGEDKKLLAQEAIRDRVDLKELLANERLLPEIRNINNRLNNLSDRQKKAEERPAKAQKGWAIRLAIMRIKRERSNGAINNPQQESSIS